MATRNGRDFFLMACWLAMAAAEVDGFNYGRPKLMTFPHTTRVITTDTVLFFFFIWQLNIGKYSDLERAGHREAFYRKYLSPDLVWDENEEDDLEIEEALGKYAIESCRIDLLPTVAMERLGLHNELCSLKWTDPNKWMKEGFRVSARFDSMKR